MTSTRRWQTSSATPRTSTQIKLSRSVTRMNRSLRPVYLPAFEPSGQNTGPGFGIHARWRIPRGIVIGAAATQKNKEEIEWEHGPGCMDAILEHYAPFMLDGD